MEPPPPKKTDARLFQVKSIIGPSLVSMPLINPCFGCRRRLQSSRRAEQEPRHCLTPSVPLRLAGGFGRILREGMSLLLHWGSTTRSRADKRQGCLPLPSTRPVLGAVTRKEGERHRSLSGDGRRRREAQPRGRSRPLLQLSPTSPSHPSQPHSPPPARIPALLRSEGEGGQRHQCPPNAPCARENANHEQAVKTA